MQHISLGLAVLVAVYMMLVSVWLTRFEYDAGVGVEGCCLTTVGDTGLVLRRSRSLTSSCANRSSFSALVCSATFFPRNSTDSTFFCASISSATHPPLAAPPRPARGVPVACADIGGGGLVGRARRVQGSRSLRASTVKSRGGQ
jgi:hypothetical protein